MCIRDRYIAVITIILSTLCVELFAQFVTVIGAHGVEIPVGIYPAHIIHSGCYRRFDKMCIRDRNSANKQHEYSEYPFRHL